MQTDAPGALTMSAIKLALAARRLREEGGGGDLLRSEPIAVIGIGCRLPGGITTPEDYWRALEGGTDAIREIPLTRWDIDAYYDPNPRAPAKMSSRWAGLLDRLDLFDADFFGIAPREAASMDPQQRLLLEVSWEALNDAGRPPESLAGTATGVFFALYNSDYSRLLLGDVAQIDGHASSGTSHGIAAGRLSYLLDLHGPSIAVDTACSSSLVAVHLACQSLRGGECSLAVAGGANVLIAPEESIALSKWGMLAADGRCKTFDAAANGFVRGEGCGVIVLKRLADALADRDPIHGLIRGSAVNQDGRSTVLTAPNGLAQQAVLRQALANARVEPRHIGYVEAHGTGTAVGDPIEVEALGATIGAPRADGTRCRLGSVKTNIGHLEAAAGIAGLIKVLLALRHERIPPHLHFTRLNPLISLDGTCLSIGAEAHPWPAGSVPRFAGVSSFGFGGTNAHIVLEEAPRVQPAPRDAAAERPWLLPISARSVPALLESVANLKRHLLSSSGVAPLAEVCYTAGVRRWHFATRAAFVANNLGEMVQRLEDFRSPAPGDSADAVGVTGKLAFVFSGHGSHWVGMGRSLYDRNNVFRAELEKCDAAVHTFAGWSVLAALAASAQNSQLQETEIFQPVLFSLQTALAAVWASWGISPDVVIGHSVGEIAAAHVAKALTLNEAARLVVLRGRLMQNAPPGSMAAAALDPAAAEAFISRLGIDVGVAAVNAPRAVTLSGTTAAIDSAVAALGAQQVSARRLAVTRAFHSPLMAPCADELYALLQNSVHANPLQSGPGSVAFHSTVEGGPLDMRRLDAEYWARNVRQPVLFAAAVSSAMRAGCTTFIEIGPHPVLTGALRQCAQSGGADSLVLDCQRRDEDGQATMFAALASLYTAGTDIDWRRIYPTGACVSLPPYAWQRELHWPPAPSRGPATVQLAPPVASEWPGRVTRSAFFSGAILEAEISANTPEFLGDHRLYGIAAMPFTAIIDLALECARTEWNCSEQDHAVIEHMSVDRALLVGEDERRVIQSAITAKGPREGKFQLFSRTHPAPPAADWIMHASCSVRWSPAASTVQSRDAGKLSLANARHQCPSPVEVDAHYQRLYESGLEFGPRFRRMTELWRGPGAGLARIQDAPPPDIASRSHVDPAVLDACLQAITAAYAESAVERELLVPVSARRIWLTQSPRPAWSCARVSKPTGYNGTLSADVWLFAESGEIIGGFEELRLNRTTRDRLERLLRPSSTSLYTLEWTPHALALDHRNFGPCLIFGDASGRAERLAEALDGAGARCVVVTHGAAFNRSSPARYEISPESAADLHALLEDLAVRGLGPPAHVIHCWGLNVPPASRAANLSAEQALSCGSALRLLQALHAHFAEAPPRVWFLTRRAVAPLEPGAVVEPTQSPLQGLVRVAALEYPEFHCTTIDVDADAGDPLPVAALVAELTGNDGAETQVQLAADARLVARLQPLASHIGPTTTPRETNRELCAPASGVLEDLMWSVSDRRRPAAGELEIEVVYAGLNFRDVLTVLKVVPGFEGLGAECAGRVVAVGEAVTNFSVGDEVMALAMGGLKSYVTVEARFVARLPAGIAARHAAALPIIFLTALYALGRVTQLRAGQKILIHAAAGGVGGAALQLAKLSGAEIFATAGTAEKRALVRSWGAHHVLDSRSVEFDAAVRSLTNGRGVDVVLNSLSGEFAARSLALVRPGGVFIELGKRDLQDPQILASTHPGVRYVAFDIADIAARDPPVIESLLGEIERLFAARQVALPPMAFFAADDMVEAFRTMAQGRHVGKILIAAPEVPRAPPRPHLAQGERPQGAYVISGGLGAIGLHLANWLIDRGATRIALLTRRDAKQAAEVLEKLRARGTLVECYSVDVGDRQALNKVLNSVRQTLGGLRGVLHAAGVLDDSTIGQTDWTRFHPALISKIDGGWNLHELTRDDPLEMFVLFSSLASVLGWSGQANYAAGNAFLDALAHHRQALGLTATSINWGPWAGTGMAANLQGRDRERLSSHGLEPMSVAQALQAVDLILQHGVPQALALAVDWPRYAARQTRALLQHVLPRERRTTESDVAVLNLRAELAALPTLQRWPRLVAFVERHAAQALGLAPGKTVPLHRPLRDLGLDSLMSVELCNSLAASLGVALSATLLFDYPTIETLSRYLARDVLKSENESPPDTPDPAHAERRGEIEAIRTLSDEEAEAALLRELNRTEQ
jgi:mycoketide-CoA synthase